MSWQAAVATRMSAILDLDSTGHSAEQALGSSASMGPYLVETANKTKATILQGSDPPLPWSPGSLDSETTLNISLSTALANILGSLLSSSLHRSSTAQDINSQHEPEKAETEVERRFHREDAGPGLWTAKLTQVQRVLQLPPGNPRRAAPAQHTPPNPQVRTRSRVRLTQRGHDIPTTRSVSPPSVRDLLKDQGAARLASTPELQGVSGSQDAMSTSLLGLP
ncbi:hypothetical protein H920_07383 [Fukomys damarensis]|uniref:Uncharacterized protein n=1 Tax=Fukomys damarensis TaxID=885580 RepID=A0A091DJG7_FUKDA|nr:hypothetical protein H920_07383 [Fukomys damarensis]